ncbi:Enhancer of mRNA-decapping protein 4 [Taenia crassiceps]|uniref:Enhancer of mRNA-decapping protein 4 n=1 Tax=Taenia crassiceps TaxID=6207 RepID=A0ABR4Q5T4_9CEST
MESSTEKIFLDGNGYEEFHGIHSSSVDIVASSLSALRANGKSSSSSCRMIGSTSIIQQNCWRVTRHQEISRGLLKINHIDGLNNLLISINLNENNSTLTHCALKWGPKCTIPEDRKDPSLLLAVALDRDAYIVDLNGVIEKISSDATDFRTESAQYRSCPRLLSKFLMRFSTCGSNIEAMEFTADASTVFIGVSIGQILMFKISDDESESFSPYRKWTSGTSPLSALHYVNYKSISAPLGYLIGGTNFNRELLLWRLPDCSLVQTIRFCPNEERDQEDGEIIKASPQPLLITSFSVAANLLLASDIKRTVLYALHLSRNPDTLEEVQFRCVSEFLLVSPCIAFDVSRVSRSLSLDRPFVSYDPEDSDNIEVLLNLIHPKDLKTGKLSYSVPLGVYMRRDQHTKEEKVTPEPSLDNDPLSTVGTVGNCSSPLLPEGNKSSIFSSPFNVFTKMFNRRPTSASSRPYTPPPNGDAPCVPPPTESSLSVDSSTPQAVSEHEGTPTSQSFGGDLCDSRNDGEESFSTVEKTSCAELANENLIVATVFGPESSSSLHISATDPSQLPFRGMGGLSKASELSDSVRSLAGSSSVASLSNSICRDPSVLDFSRPVNDVFAKVMSLSMNQPLSDSVRSLDGSSNDLIATSGSLKSLQTHHVVAPALSSTESGASGEVEVIQLLKSLLAETKAQAASIKTLTNKVHENRNQLTKLANVQATILRQVNSLTPSPTSSSITTATSESPSLANQLMDQVRKQKAETTKQLTHLETILNNIQNSVTSKASTKKPQPTSLLDAKQVQTLQEQTRNVVRTEFQSIFQSNIPMILDPLRQHLRASLEEMLSPLPKTVADRMVSVIVDPKFAQYFSGQMSTTIAPSMTIAYREELRRVLVPAFTKGIDKLTKELDELVKSALNQHMELIIAKMDSGVQSSRDKIDASVRKFDDQVNRLSKDIAVKVTTQIDELLKVASQQQPQPPAPDIAMSSASAVGGAGLSASTLRDLSVKGSRSAFDTAGGGGSKQQLRNFISGGTASADPYQSALMFIQNHQYAEALETALTSANQALLLKVLQNVPVVQLFRQNVKQELLLSLIHQLGCGQLQEQLEMKISFLQEAVNHLRMNDDTVKELGNDILSMLVTKITHLRGTDMLTAAEENRALVLLRSIQEKWQNRTFP